MALALKAKQQQVESGFEAARRRYEQRTLPYLTMLEEERALAIAISLAANYQDADADRCAAARVIAAKYRKIAERQPEEARRRLEQIRYDIEEAAPQYRAEVDAWNAAKRDETNRIARELVPAHRAAVEAIGKAFEELSQAIESERTVRAELVRRAPEPASALLPDASPAIGVLAEWDSAPSTWARKIRNLGFNK